MQAPGYKMADIKRFFRVGVVLGKPWAWIENATDPLDRKYLDPNKKNLGLVGKFILKYCFCYLLCNTK